MIILYVESNEIGIATSCPNEIISEFDPDIESIYLLVYDLKILTLMIFLTFRD